MRSRTCAYNRSCKKNNARPQLSPLAPVSTVTCYPPPPHRSTYLSHAIVAALAKTRWRARRSQRRTRASNGEMQNSKRSARKAQSREVAPPMQCKRGVHAWLSCARPSTAWYTRRALFTHFGLRRERIHERAQLRALHPHAAPNNSTSTRRGSHTFGCVRYPIAPTPTRHTRKQARTWSRFPR